MEIRTTDEQCKGPLKGALPSLSNVFACFMTLFGTFCHKLVECFGQKHSRNVLRIGLSQCERSHCESVAASEDGPVKH